MSEVIGGINHPEGPSRIIGIREKLDSDGISAQVSGYTTKGYSF